MKNIEDEEDDLTGDSWMHKKLKFESEDPVLAKDANTKDDDWFDIYDPRNPLNKRRREKKKTQTTCVILSFKNHLLKKQIVIDVVYVVYAL